MYKMVIVDDETLLRKGLTCMVDWKNYDIEIIGEAASTDEAIAIIEKEVPDIVITDIRMPGKNGIDLVYYIRNNFPQIQLIVLSGFSDFEYVRTSLTLGALDYILKPRMTPEELLKAIEKAKIQSPKNQVNLPEFSDKQDKNAVLNYKYIDEMLETLDFGSIIHNLKSFLSAGNLVLKDCISMCVDLYYHIVFKIEQMNIATNHIRNRRFSYVEIIQNSGDLDTLLNSFEAIIAEINRNLKRKKQTDLIEKIQAYIQNHYNENITLQNIADHFHFSKEYLSNKYKQETGKNIKDYLQEVRINKAKELLRTKDMRIQEVAKEVGFENPNYFGQVFKKIVGITPMEYVSLFT